MSAKNKLFAVMTIGCGLAWTGQISAAEQKAKAPADASTPNEVVFPKSVFDLAAPTVKDPFYPQSLRSLNPLPAATNAEPAAISSKSFVLKGLSLSSFESTAIINNRTLAEGERALLPVEGFPNKVGVTVLKIKTAPLKSVVIQVDGNREPIELFLPKSDQ